LKASKIADMMQSHLSRRDDSISVDSRYFQTHEIRDLGLDHLDLMKALASGLSEAEIIREESRPKP
jgi:hypothetical protein